MPWNKDGTRKKSSSYKMKYSNSAFPFKSPLKDNNLKGIDISSASIESLKRMEKETDKSTSPNDWAKINDAISFNVISKAYKKGDLTSSSDKSKNSNI